MKKTKSKITYGVYNLVEWFAVLRMGKAAVKVPFTGGSITTQGVTPATYTTDNPVVQFAIESSPEFKSGKIKVVRRVKLEGEVVIERNAPKAESAKTEVCAEAKAGQGEGGNECEELVKAPAGGGGLAAESESDGAAAAESAAARIMMEFSCNDEARDYLEQSFGVVRSKMRTRADILTCAEVNGVDIKFV